MIRPGWAQDLSTILGAGLLVGGIVLWLEGRIATDDILAVAAAAGTLIGIPQHRPSATTNVSASGPLTITAPAVAVAATSEKP